MNTRIQSTFQASNCKFYGVVLLALMASCLLEKEPQFYLPGSASEEIFMDFAGRRLTGFSSALPAHPEKIAELIQNPGPFFWNQDEQLCLQSHSPYFFAREAGLRWLFCLKEAGDALRLSQVINQLPELQGPVMAGQNYRLLRTDYRKLDKEIGRIQIALSGNPEKPLLKAYQLTGHLNFDASVRLAPDTLPVNPLPWKFEQRYYDILVAEQKLIFLYPQEDGILALEVSDPIIVSAFAGALANLPGALYDTLQSTGAGEVFISEFSDSKKAIELGGPVKNALASYSLIQDGEKLISEQRFFFAQSAHTYYLENTGDTILLEQKNSSQIQFSKYAPLENRSYERSAPEEEFAPSLLCAKSHCNSLGYLRPDAPPPAESSCKIQDILLTEVNPTGIQDQNNLDPYGKFIELISQRECKPENLLIQADQIALETPVGELWPAGQIKLFAATDRYFSKEAILAYLLRGLKPGSFVRLTDLARREQAVYEIPGGQYLFLDGAIASLSYDSAGQGKFHAPGQANWLRPDLPEHHMSPGMLNPSPEAVSIELSEIMPGSFRKDDGSLSAESFVEFYIERKAEIEELAILAITTDTEQSFYPVSIGNASGHAVATSSKNPFCLPESPVQRISIPEEGSFSLSKGRAVSDQVSFPGNTPPYTSLQKVRPNLWARASRPPSPACSLYAKASPGRFAEYDGFIHKNANGSLQFISMHTEQLELRLSNTSSILYAQLQDTANNELLIQPGQNYAGRLDFSIWRGAAKIWQEEIYRPEQRIVVQTISPSPGTGEVEWIRLCAKSSQQFSKLYFSDSSTTDEIIPWSFRSTGPGPGDLDTQNLKLEAGKCALIVDPDYSGQVFPDANFDQAFWTIASSSALGNGLSGQEQMLFFTEQEELAGFALDGVGLDVPTGNRIERLSGTNDSYGHSFGVKP